MKIRFWGVRGSIPSPSKSTAEIGGNTSCVEIVTHKGFSIVMDAGTGIRDFGLDYLKRKGAPRIIHLFISHVHWDHIQGFPFFLPIYLADFEIHIYGCKGIKQLLGQQMRPPFFPLNIDELNSKMIFHELETKSVKAAGCSVSPISLVHPQEVFGFKVSENGKSVVYSSDTEYEVGGNTKSYVAKIKNADVLLYDAQYTPQEYENGRIGWGHSTYEAAVEIAQKAAIKKLVLFHHEPSHNDATVLQIEKSARELFPNTLAAREGMTIEL